MSLYDCRPCAWPFEKPRHQSQYAELTRQSRMHYYGLENEDCPSINRIQEAGIPVFRGIQLSFPGSESSPSDHNCMDQVALWIKWLFTPPLVHSRASHWGSRFSAWSKQEQLEPSRVRKMVVWRIMICCTYDFPRAEVLYICNSCESCKLAWVLVQHGARASTINHIS